MIFSYLISPHKNSFVLKIQITIYYYQRYGISYVFSLNVFTSFIAKFLIYKNQGYLSKEDLDCKLSVCSLNVLTVLTIYPINELFCIYDVLYH